MDASLHLLVAGTALISATSGFALRSLTDRRHRNNLRFQAGARATAHGLTPNLPMRSGPYESMPLRDNIDGWLLALSALHCERHALYHDRIDLLPTGCAEDAGLAQCATDWGIETANRWQQACRWLRERGHRSELKLLRELTTRSVGHSPLVGPVIDPDAMGTWFDDFSDTYGPTADRRREQFDLLLKSDPRLTGATGAAYDASRLLMLYRLGVRLGYLPQNEAQLRMQEIGSIVAGHFRSWTQYIRDLLASTIFFEGTPAEIETRAIIQRLRQPDMPWRRVGWHGHACRYADLAA